MNKGEIQSFWEKRLLAAPCALHKIVLFGSFRNFYSGPQACPDGVDPVEHELSMQCCHCQHKIQPLEQHFLGARILISLIPTLAFGIATTVTCAKCVPNAAFIRQSLLVDIFSFRKVIDGMQQIAVKLTTGSPRQMIDTIVKRTMKECKKEMVESVAKCCGFCGRSRGLIALQVCSKCRIVRYCSKDCQRLDWAQNHKVACEEIKALYE